MQRESKEEQLTPQVGASSVRPPGKPPNKNIPLPFEFKICPTVSAIHQQHDQHEQPLGDINLPSWQQHPTSAPEQPLGEINLLLWQQPQTSALDTPSPWLVLTTMMSKADKIAVAKTKTREATSLAMTKDQMNKMLGEYINLPFYSPEPKQRVHDAIQELLNCNN